jgi:hypothetical protein
MFLASENTRPQEEVFYMDTEGKKRLWKYEYGEEIAI